MSHETVQIGGSRVGATASSERREDGATKTFAAQVCRSRGSTICASDLAGSPSAARAICASVVQRLRSRLAKWFGASRDEVGDPLVLWCEYAADPTWRFVDGGPRVSAVSLDTLALADATKSALRAWARTFEEITWPPDAEAEPTLKQWDEFIREGERLRDLVAAELGPQVEVVLGHR